MRVQFEYTLDDVVDVQLRALKRSAAARAWRWQDMVVTSLLSGVLLFAIIPGETSSRLIVGLIGLILGALLYPIVNESTVKRRLRKLFQENAGPDKVLICEVELTNLAYIQGRTVWKSFIGGRTSREFRRPRIQWISTREKGV